MSVQGDLIALKEKRSFPRTPLWKVLDEGKSYAGRNLMMQPLVQDFPKGGSGPFLFCNEISLWKDLGAGKEKSSDSYAPTGVIKYSLLIPPLKGGARLQAHTPYPPPPFRGGVVGGKKGAYAGGADAGGQMQGGGGVK
jgi:hypothetical protein